MAPGQFFGSARRARSTASIDISHRIAEGAPEEVVTHTHYDAHFILVTGGAYVSAAGRSPAAGETVLVYNPPGTTHRDHFEHGSGSFFAVSIRPGAAAVALGELCAPSAPLYLTALHQHGLAMRIAGASALEAESLTLDTLCLELLASLDPRVRRARRTPPGWLHAALELLHDRYSEDLTVAQIAADLGVHPVYLARAFRNHFGCSPGEFVRFRRLERSLALLSRTGHPLAEVALRCGFADQSHFTKVFTRGLGLPPGEYRALVGSRPGALHKLQIDKTAPSRWRKVAAWAAAARASTRWGR